jgi:hypothetical protein
MHLSHQVYVGSCAPIPVRRRHQYGQLLADAPEFVLPRMHDGLPTVGILAMTHVGDDPIESVLGLPQAERDRVAELLFSLLFREIFQFKLIQTDPNFANYRYDRVTRQLILLDFGATRPYLPALVNAYRQLFIGGINQDRSAMNAAAIAIVYFQADIRERQRQAVLDIFSLACEPLRHVGSYDFGTSDLAARVRDAGLVLGRDRDFWHTPPAAALFLHRKLGGMCLLAASLKTRVDMRRLVDGHLV